MSHDLGSRTTGYLDYSRGNDLTAHFDSEQYPFRTLQALLNTGAPVVASRRKLRVVTVTEFTENVVNNPYNGRLPGRGSYIFDGFPVNLEIATADILGANYDIEVNGACSINGIVASSIRVTGNGRLTLSGRWARIDARELKSFGMESNESIPQIVLYHVHDFQAILSGATSLHAVNCHIKSIEMAENVLTTIAHSYTGSLDISQGVVNMYGGVFEGVTGSAEYNQVGAILNPVPGFD